MGRLSVSAMPEAQPGNSAALPCWVSGSLMDSGTADAMKAILIVAICIGHNRLLTGSIDGLFPALYFWHVQGFFFLAFATRGLTIGSKRPVDVIVRYMVPFVVFTGAAVAGLMVLSHRPEALLDWAKLLWSGAAAWSETATGMQLFWFLPALTTFVIVQVLLSRLLAHVRPEARRTYLAGICMVGLGAYCAALALPITVQLALPWCLGLVAFLFPLSMAFSAVYAVFIRAGAAARAAMLVCSALLVVATLAHVLQGNRINVAKFAFGLHGDNPLDLVKAAVLAGAGAVAANLLVAWIADALRGIRLVTLVGRNSLRIYLFHAFVQFAAWAAIHRIAPQLAPLPSVLLGVAVTIFAIAVSLVIGSVIDRLPRLRQAVFPKDLAALRAAISGTI